MGEGQGGGGEKWGGPIAIESKGGWTKGPGPSR